MSEEFGGKMDISEWCADMVSELGKDANVKMKVTKGDLAHLSEKVLRFTRERYALCQPDNLYICDGSKEENDELLELLASQGLAKKLTSPKFENGWLVETDPRDVARVEGKTVLCTQEKRQSVPDTKPGVQGKLGNWISPKDLFSAFKERFPGCMLGRTMYLLPYSMGPVGSPLSKIGIQLTDSAYVVCCTFIMTRMGRQVLDVLGENDFVKCLHSVGQPVTRAEQPKNIWPCNPDKTIISHIPDQNEIVAFGSGYGGNSLLGKKCFSLRIGSTLANREGWLAEHMLILGLTNAEKRKHYITAAFPSCCGKTNLAMLQPTLPGFKAECVGDDIAWMRFDEKSGQLRAINPENGFFSVAPGTSRQTNKNAMATLEKNTIFTNVAQTSDGGVFWEGIDEDAAPPGVTITSWLGEENWSSSGSKGPAAHPNSRFCTPARQCPSIDPNWENPHGVPVDAILFGGRRPEGVPLVFESFSWPHGVFVGAAMKSEVTAAAEHKGHSVQHDPFGMRPFFGYNFGRYIQHWLSMADKPSYKLPRIFHVNWFRKDDDGNFMWPGFGENTRVLDWIMRRCEGEEGIAVETPIGYIPTQESFKLDGLEKPVDWDALFRVEKKFWMQEWKEIAEYFDTQVGADLPAAIQSQLDALKTRLENYRSE